MKKLLKDLKAEYQTFEDAQLLVAVSGGMDSMLMAELLLKAKIPFAVAHVNYQLRGKDSEKDEQFVKAYCKKNKLTFHCAQAGDLWKESKNNLQERARDFRYTYFQQLQDEVGYTTVVLAHHAKKDLEKFGFTLGCAGCRAANRGSTAVGHTEECRKRIMGELEKAGDERLER